MMTRDVVRAFFDSQQAEWDARDAEALARRHARDGIVVSPIFRTVQGYDEILESYRQIFTIFPDWQFRGDGPLVDESKVALPFSVRATHVGELMGLSGTGRQCEFAGVLLIEMKDGLILHERRFYDFTGLLVQLGVLRGKPARP